MSCVSLFSCCFVLFRIIVSDAFLWSAPNLRFAGAQITKEKSKLTITAYIVIVLSNGSIKVKLIFFFNGPICLAVVFHAISMFCAIINIAYGICLSDTLWRNVVPYCNNIMLLFSDTL